MLAIFFAVPRVAHATPEDHVFYLGTNQHVYDVWWYGGQDGNEPTVWDATALAGAPTAAPGGGLAAYFIDAELFLYFVTSNDHLGLLYYYSGHWYYDDLTSLAGAPAPLTSTTPLVGYRLGGTPYVFYQYGTSPCLAEVYGIGPNVWTWDSPSSLAGAPACESDTPLTGFSIDSERLLYYSDGTDVHELKNNNGGGWIHTNISDVAGAPSAVYNSALSGFSYGLQAHVYYIDGAGRVDQLYSNDGSPWTFEALDFSELYTQSPPLIPIASYPYASDYHVIFAYGPSCVRGKPGDCENAEVYAPVNTENWVEQGVGPNGLGAISSQPGPIVGHNNTDSNTEHVFYIDGTYNVLGQAWSLGGSDNWYAYYFYENAPAIAPTSQMASAFY